MIGGIVFGSSASAQWTTCGSIPTCSNSAEQEALSSCLNDYQWFDGDLLQILQGCFGNNTTTTSCGLHGYHCSQGTQQAALNNCILANQITDTSTIANRCIAPLWLSSCTADPAPCASCGSSNGISTTDIPSSSPEWGTSALCEIGYPSSVSTINNTYNRTCTTSNIGNTNSSTCTAYKSVSSSRDGVCGTAQNQQTTSAPTTNLCSKGTSVLSYTIPVIGTPITMYRWSCLPYIPGWKTTQCSSYQTPTQAVQSIPYSGTTLNTKISLPQTRRSLGFTGYNKNEIYTSSDTTLTKFRLYDFYHTISPNIELHINIFGNSDQLIQFWEKSVNGVDFYGCNASGWNVSLTGIIPDEMLQKIPVTNNDNDTATSFKTNTMPTDLSNIDIMDIWTLSTVIQKDGMWQYNSVYVPKINRYINPHDFEERFFAWDDGAAIGKKWFVVTCDLTTTITPPTTRTGACIGLPANAIPNIATGIVQYAGTSGWSPGTGYNYDPTPSTTSCNFICNPNYTRNTTTLTCTPNTQTVACNGVQPTNATPTSGTTYIQTRSGTGWLPTISWNTGTGSCGYTCNTNHTLSGSTCAPNTGTTTCNVAGFSIPNATIIATGTFATLRDNTNNTWITSPSRNTNRQYTGSTTLPTANSGCYYSCNADSVWTGWACVQRVYSRHTGDWGACAVTVPAPIPTPVCNAPVLTSSDVTVTQDTSIAWPNGIFNIWFDQDLYKNVKVNVTWPISSIWSITNNSPAFIGYFWTTTWSMNITAECKSNNQQVTSNTITATGRNSPVATSPVCNKVWIDNTPFNRWSVGYGYFTANKVSVNPMTNLQDACQWYLINSSTKQWSKIECVATGNPFNPGNWNWYKYLLNGGWAANTIIWTDQYGVPTNPPTTNAGGYTNTPTYSTISAPEARLNNGSMSIRFIPVAQACAQ